MKSLLATIQNVDKIKLPEYYVQNRMLGEEKAIKENICINWKKTNQSS